MIYFTIYTNQYPIYRNREKWFQHRNAAEDQISAAFGIQL